MQQNLSSKSGLTQRMLLAMIDFQHWQISVLHFGKNMICNFLCFISGFFCLTFSSFQTISKVIQVKKQAAHLVDRKKWNAAHLWHSYYSSHTKVLQALACHVCSKVLGIGGANHSWKKMKENKSRKRANISTEKAKIQATIVGIYFQENNNEDHTKKCVLS